jgi:hypothetical protein
LGTLIFKDNDSKEIIIWKNIDTEKKEDYEYLKSELDSLGYTIKSVVLDAKRGIDKPFKNIPRQIFHFHQVKIVKRYITQNPKLEASIELKKIIRRIKYTNKRNFTILLDEWYEKYKLFLSEKTVLSTTGKLQYTHPRVRSAYRSLKTNLPYLFTHKNPKYKDLNIQNTTNSIEGGVFSHMKSMVSLHRRLTKSMKLMLRE